MSVTLIGSAVAKVTDQNGTIHKVCYLTASDIVGVVIGATKAGHIVGKVLEDWTQAGTRG